MSKIARRRAHLEEQGFTGLSDREVRQLDPWIRLAPAAVPVTTGFCVASFLWNRLVGRRGGGEPHPA